MSHRHSSRSPIYCKWKLRRGSGRARAAAVRRQGSEDRRDGGELRSICSAAPLTIAKAVGEAIGAAIGSLGALRGASGRSAVLAAALFGVLGSASRRSRSAPRRPEKRFFLAMGENGPYSETSFY